ncbi:hypothetical protein BC332_18816 [Capsicum chinense]|nr:hypothetical protein BC332_18816 [Capsicum chinense]
MVNMVLRLKTVGVFAAFTLNVVGVTERGRGFVGVVGRGRGGFGAVGRSGETFVAAISNVGGVAGRGKGIFVAGASNIGDVAGKVRGTTFKRPRLVGMGVLHIQSGFTIHNAKIPLNSFIVTENLGHHKPRSGVKWKGKNFMT